MESYRSVQQSNATRSQKSVYSSQSQRVITMTGSEYGGGLVMSSEDQWLAGQVEQQHSSNGPQLNNVRSLFNHAIFMFKDAGVLTGSEGGMEAKAAKLETTLEPNITQMIRLVLCEMGCKCPGGAGSERDIQSSMLAVVGALRKCEWEEKMVITLAVFAVKLWEFLQITRMYSGDSLADSMALLKQPPATEVVDALKKKLSDIIILMLQVTDQVVSFTHHLTSSTNFSADHPSVEAVRNTLPIVACWIVMSAVAASTHISMVATSTTNNPSATGTTTSQLSKCSDKLKQILKDFQEKTKFVVRKQEKEAYKKLRMTFYEDVSRDIKTLICSNINDDSPPLCDASNNKVQLDVLQKQTVLLLITGKDHHNLPELDMLENIYGVLEKKQCRIVWVPVLEGSSSSTTWSSTSETTGRPRPWYCVANPSEIKPAVIRFFKEDLAFKGHPTLVCLQDTREGFRSVNVLHLLTIWKEAAIPFTKIRAVELWNKQSSLTLDLLVDNMVVQASDWVKKDEYIVVYGGEIDGNWIRDFKQAIKGFAGATSRTYKCVYVGKSCMQGVHKLSDKSFGHFLEEDQVRVFWTRLESMLYTKIQLDMVDDEDDLVTREIKKIMSYDKSKDSWAVICKGNKVINVVSGTTILEVFQYDKWERQVTERGGFESALKIQIADVGRLEHHCVRFEFPDAAGAIPLTMKCHGCSQPMQKLTVFSCCRDAPEDATAPNGHVSSDSSEETTTSESTETTTTVSRSRHIVNE